MIYGPDHFYEDKDYRRIHGHYKPEWLKTAPEIKADREKPIVPPSPSRLARSIMTAAPTLRKTDPFFLRKLLEAVASEFRFSVDQLRSQIRKQELVDARHVFCWLARNHSSASYPMIGRMLDRDHSTVMHGVKVINASNGFFQPQIDRIVARIEQEE